MDTCVKGTHHQSFLYRGNATLTPLRIHFSYEYKSTQKERNQLIWILVQHLPSAQPQGQDHDALITNLIMFRDNHNSCLRF